MGRNFLCETSDFLKLGNGYFPIENNLYTLRGKLYGQ